MHFLGRHVRLRAIERGDLTALAAFHNDPDTARTLEFSWPLSLANQEDFFERARRDPNSKRLVVETEEHGVIGYSGLWGIDWVDRRATNGIIIGRGDLRGRGLGTDTIMAVMRAAFDHVGLQRLDADIVEHNTASLRLYVEKCGWKEEGRRRQHAFAQGRYWDRVLVGITAAEYREMIARTGYWNQ